MRPGPKPKPNVLKLMSGNPGKRPIKQSVQVTGKAVQPAGLKEHGQQKWKELEAVLGPLNLLTAADAGMAFMYCHAWDEFYDAMATIAEKGRYSTNQQGAPCQSVAIKDRNWAFEQIRKLSSEFGLSPAARVGLRVTPAPDGDDLDQYKVG